MSANTVLPSGLPFRRGIWMARSVYEGVLDRVERLGFDVLRHRAALPPWELAGAVATGLRASA